MTASVYLILETILGGIFVCGCFAAGPIFFMLGAPIFFILEAILYGIFVRGCCAAKSDTWVVRKANCKNE